MSIPYTFDVSARYSTGWVPIDRLPAVEVPKKGERFVVDGGLAKRMFEEGYKEIASLFPVDLGTVSEIRHFIDLHYKRSYTNIWTDIADSALDKPRRFNEFVRQWNTQHLPKDTSLPHEMYRKHSPTYWYDLQVNVPIRNGGYCKLIRNVPFEVEVVPGHNFNLYDDGGHSQHDVSIIISETKSIVHPRKGSNPIIHVDFVGIKEDKARMRPKIQERQFERLDLFERDWMLHTIKVRKTLQ